VCFYKKKNSKEGKESFMSTSLPMTKWNFT
jgi:hypothetical protein